MIATCIYNLCFWSACVFLTAKIVFCSSVQILDNGISGPASDTDAISMSSDCESYRFVHTSSLTANDTLVLGGYEIEFDMRLGLHICRANHKGNVIPGKRVPGACYVPFEGQGFDYKDHEVLLNPKAANLYWVPSSDFDIMDSASLPQGAIPAGRTDSGDILYVGRCYVQQRDGNMIAIPGNVNLLEVPTRAHVVFGSQTEYVCDEYEILVCT